MRNYDSSAEAVVSLLGKLFHFKTVMEAGCTEKAWLKAFKKNGANVMGFCMVGHPVDFGEENIPTQNIDFETKGFRVEEKQDLALSIDFAEKFGPECLGRYLDDLTGMSDIILFSSQLPDVISSTQKTGHEKVPAHWQELFGARGFVAIDCIRPRIWESSSVLLRYKQGMVLYVREKSLSQYPRLLEFYLKHEDGKVMDVIHPVTYRNNTNFLQGKLNALTVKVKHSKRVLYVFYHPAALPWAVVHSLTMHRRDDVYFSVAVDIHGWQQGEKRRVLLQLMDKGVIKSVYSHRQWLGQSREYDTLEKSQKCIMEGMESDFAKQWFDFRSFHTIYVHTDHCDAIGLYLSIKGIKYNWFEMFPHSLLHMTEAAINICYKEQTGYRDLLIKYRTMYGDNVCKHHILYPNSKRGVASEGSCSVFDIEKAAECLNENDKNLLKDIFGLNDIPIYEHVMVMLQSLVESEHSYRDNFLIRKEYKNVKDFAYSAVQFILDYFVPTSEKIIIKPHPAFYDIDEKDSKKYFNGAYIYPLLCTVLLMKILPNEYSKHKCIVQVTSTANNQMDKNLERINCPGMWIFPIFCNKYYISLSILDFLNCLSDETVHRFNNIGELGKIVDYNRMMMDDIKSLMKIHFPSAKGNHDVNYEVINVAPEMIAGKARSCDFVIY
ncbi:MAG: hypothetical protein IKH16_11700, partial [Selenomonadaceae bacterium]|nr:hypothetical protein [Selenomonadaceae bacterium]